MTRPPPLLAGPRPTAPRALLALLLAAAPPAGALAAAALLLPAPAAAQAASNRIVAVVNGDVVTRNDIEGRRRLFAISAGLPVSAQALDGLNDQVLRLLIDERLRMQEVQRRRIPVMDNEIAETIREIEQRNNLPPGGLRAQLQRAGVEPRVLYDQIRVQIGWARLIRRLLGSQAEPSESEVREYIEAARAREGQPEYLLSEIFIPVEDPARAEQTRRFVEEVVAQLRRGTPFAIAATQFSQAQSALQGGDLGWVRPEQLDPEVARIVAQMPVGAVTNPVRVAGGWQIVALRQRRESGREMATILSLRQAFLPFSSPLDPQNPTPQQREAVERARRLQGAGCDAVEAAARGTPRPADPGPIRLESVEAPPLRQLLASLPIGRASQPIVSPDGVMVLAVCARETRNLAELTPDQARAQIVRDRVELLSRQLQRDLRRRAQIEIRLPPAEPDAAPRAPAPRAASARAG
ncbi:peptidylprolyl isomerase [Caldovatus aquaticus]|uniref:Parvulin-like PPIase n=1 Tax=Caldovatus aquaticus TaxID=2865671 RepID=A0ABS7F7F9_9PROT|nr:peptidylprolyl isomerase [Caldovatus aquaticus]MBW8270892.1 peptidylprolyl isomerase [Caldovatus aquaticus]